MNWRANAYRYYVLAVLSLITILNYYDRYVLSIVLQPIKMAMHLSDTEAGLLSGLAFASIYALVGVPIARIADRGNRVKVLGVAMAVWSFMTVACGLAASGVALFVARMGVGLGEAGGPPSIHALVADYFPLEKRARALSWIGAAAMLGAILGVSAGGLINDRFGWRAAFWAGGAPGLGLALIVFLTIGEPGRKAAATARSVQIPLNQAVKLLSGRSAYVFMILGVTIASIASFAQAAWLPTLLVRSYGLRPGQVGVIYALCSALPSIAGILLGGVIADRWIRKDQRVLVWILVVAYAVAIPTSLIIYLATSLKLALPATIVGALIGGTALAPTYALVQGLAGSSLRATAAAIYMVCANFVGLCIGPAMAGLLSDRLVPIAGADSLRWSLCLLMLPTLVSLPVLALAARTVRSDFEDVGPPSNLGEINPAGAHRPWSGGSAVNDAVNIEEHL